MVETNPGLKKKDRLMDKAKAKEVSNRLYSPIMGKSGDKRDR